MLEYLFLILLFYILGYVIYPWFRLEFLKRAYGSKINAFYYPIAGNLIRYRQDVKNHGDAFHTQKTASLKNADILAIIYNRGYKLAYYFCDKDLIKDVLQNDENYEKAEVALASYYLTHKGLVQSKGQQWSSQRKIISSSFHYENMSQRFDLFKGVVEKNLRDLEEGKVQRCVSMCEKVTSKIVIESFFSKDFPDILPGSNKYFLEELKEVFLLSFQHLFEDSFYIFKIQAFPVREWVFKYLNSEKEKKTIEKILNLKKQVANYLDELILEQQKNQNQTIQNNQQGFVYKFIEKYLTNECTKDEIINQFFTFYLAGTDTTGNLTAMMIYCLSKNLEIQEELFQELTENQIEWKTLGLNEIKKLSKLDSFFKETLRMYSPAPATLTRKVIQKHQIGPFTIQKGDTVATTFISNNFNSKYYQEPFKFDISRWKNNKFNSENFLFTPFSLGPRNCIGQHMATIEAKLMIIYLLQNYYIKPKENYQLQMKLVLTYVVSDQELAYFIRR